ncbi:MAG: ATP-binding protein, partial [Lachnospiraceae bacterium]|nr:ATP-binding protein [Lachnospiraceae bacterium]
MFLLGPRGTGKTTLLEKLTSELGREYVYINLEYDGEMREFMESCAQKHGSSDLFLSVAERLGIAPEASGKVLFIFDDLEYSPMIVSSLLGTDLRENLILASDLATNEIMTLAERCERVSLSTLDFGGFLEETGHQWYREVIEAHFQKKKKIPEMIHSDILDCYEDFLQTGGMPQSVAAYKASGADGVRHAQRMIKNDLSQGLNSLKDESLRGRTEAVMSSLADQALNTRFNFCEIRKGTSFGFYREAIKLLERSGIAIRIDSKGKGFEL